MKKTLLVLTAGVALFSFSCKKDSTTPDKTTTDTTKVTVNPTPTVAVTTEDLAKTTAENKAKMETAGVDFINELRSIKDTKAGGAIKSLTGLGSGSTTKSYLVTGNKLPIAKLLKSLMSGSTTSTLKSLKGSVPEANFQSEIAKIAATYTYNFATEKFDSSAAVSANVLKVLFPGKEGDVTNTGEFKVYNMSFTTVPTSNSLYTTSNAITSCNAYLKVDGVDAMTYSLTAAYDAKGLPTTIATSFTVDAFSFNYNYAYTSAKLTSDMSIKHNATILIAQGVEVNGTITETKAKELETYYKDSTITHGAAKVSEFATTGIVYYQMMDVKIIGSIDVVKFANAFDALTQTDKDTFNAADCAVLNNSCALYGIFASTQKKIADVSIYAKSQDVLDYYDVPTGETETVEAFWLTFPDGSKVDAEAYFTAANFSTLQTEIDKFKDEVNPPASTPAAQ